MKRVLVKDCLKEIKELKKIIKQNHIYFIEEIEKAFTAGINEGFRQAESRIRNNYNDMGI